MLSCRNFVELLRCLFLGCAAWSVILAPLLTAAVMSQEARPKVNFETQIWPILQAHCFECHAGQQQEGNLRVDARDPFFAGGVSGKVLTYGDANQSLLIDRLLGKGDHDRMPVDSDPLSDKQIALVRRWIDEGAQWPAAIGKQIEVENSHWAYESPTSPPLPVVQNANWPQNELDFFILSRLEAAGLHPSPPAEPGKLVRRLYLDLIGLPPALEVVERFESNPTEESYRALVDRLLATPQYGERWARPWLDMARYADTNGYQADQYRTVWPYRDWVIRALNADMPFDQFTIEQLAGDLLPDATIDQKIASGFHRLTTCNVEAGVDPEENRVNQVIDRVNTTGTVWFGTTFECMQCHNHKYDPFTQKEYYEIFAFFNKTPLEVKGDDKMITYEFVGPTMDLPLSTEQAAQRDEIQHELESLKQQLAKLESKHESGFNQWLEQQVSTAQTAAVENQDKSPASCGNWQVLEVVSFTASGGSAFEILADQSVLVGGARPDKEDYTIFLKTDLTEIHALRLETLTDKSLPDNGPGRNAAPNPNFVAHELRVYLVDKTGEERPVSLTSATADFSQQNWDVTRLIDGDPATGWGINPQFGKPHQATIGCNFPRDLQPGDQIKIVLQQNYGGTRTIGRPRFSVSSQKIAERLPANLQQLVLKTERSAAETRKLRDHYLKFDPQLKKLQAKLTALQKRLATIQPLTTLVMVESIDRETAVFKRGDFLATGEPVAPATPRVLHPFDEQFSRDRLGFARWTVDPQNPLTARVVANRAWASFFGHGLLISQEDFGTQADPPTLPELLDWLACKLIKDEWSLKNLHRQIVLSATYRQSSRITPELIEVDPRNLLYARGPRQRIAAESIRDNALAISGLISDQIGGEPVFPPQPDGIWRHVGRNEPKYLTSTGSERFRRGIYVYWRRSAPYPSFVNFDAPDRASCVVARPTTNSPLQALTLLNDPAYAEIAGAFARRIGQHASKDFDKRMQFAFKTCTARDITREELSHLKTIYDEYVARLNQDPAKAKQIAAQLNDSNEKDEVQSAAWFFMASILLNLDETITKE
jgi:hypothetical protein